jgi:uncharacterized protein (DUF2141 family)
MLRRTIPLCLILATTILILSCPAAKVTGIKGKAVMQTGQSANVRGTKVQLFETADLTGTPNQQITSSTTAKDSTQFSFEFTGVTPGDYYLLAWKDRNGNDTIDNLDLVGVYGDTFRPRYGGQSVSVMQDSLVDVGQIAMRIYNVLTMNLNATQRPPDTLDLAYRFNEDCSVTNWVLSTPWGAQITDLTQNGDKLADTIYHYDAIGVNDQPNPTGIYAVITDGTWTHGAFHDSVAVNVTK